MNRFIGIAGLLFVSIFPSSLQASTFVSKYTPADCAAFQASRNPVQEILAQEFVNGADAYLRLYCLETLMDSNDRRGIFLTMYVRTTDAVHAATEAGEFEDDVWVDEYLTSFANLYRSAFLNFDNGQYELVPVAWRRAFEAARDPNILVTQHLLLGVNAHVNYDLALALSQLDLQDQTERKYRDHTAVNKVLRRIVDDQFELISEKYAKGLGELPEAADRLSKEVFFKVLKVGREAAWKKAWILKSDPQWLHGLDLETNTFAGFILAPKFNRALMQALRRIEQDSPKA